MFLIVKTNFEFVEKPRDEMQCFYTGKTVNTPCVVIDSSVYIEPSYSVTISAQHSSEFLELVKKWVYDQSFDLGDSTAIKTRISKNSSIYTIYGSRCLYCGEKLEQWEVFADLGGHSLHKGCAIDFAKEIHSIVEENKLSAFTKLL